jgi:hypothetical protein
VGGLVTAVEDGGIRLDDGTATARVVLAGSAADLLPMLRPGDALNATGTVETGEEAVVVVGDRGGVALLGELDAPEAVDPAGTAAATGEGGSGIAVTGMAAAAALVAAGRGAGPGAMPVGPGLVPGVAALLVLVAVLGGAAVLARRARTRRLERARIVARLDAITGFGTPPPGAGMPPPAPARDLRP